MVKAYDLNILFNTEVKSLKSNQKGFKIKTSEVTFTAKYVVVATGFYDKPRLLNVPGENLSKVKHYYDEAHPYIGQKVMVVGAANSACDVALETWQKGAQVTMVVRKSTLYEKVKYWILPNIQNRINEGSITAYFNSEIKEIKEKSVLIQTEEGIREIENDYVLAMTGYKPDFELMRKFGIQFSNDKDKIPIYNEGSLESNVSNLYLAGVILSGMKTSTLFIENTRTHGEIIIKDLIYKNSIA